MTLAYKYTKYRKDFFDNFLLKISRFGEFNDPFEMVPGDLMLSLPETEAAELLSQCHALSDPDHYLECYLNMSAGVRSSLGVVCFSERNDNLLMWAHYANNHDGICIELEAKPDLFSWGHDESNNLNFPPTNKHRYKNCGVLTKVKYSRDRPLFMDPAELEHETESWFTKSEDWAYEQELRVLIPLDNAIRRDDMFFCAIDKQCIKSIILGCQMDSEEKKEVHAICSKLGIAVKESFISSSKYALDIVKYHPDNHHSHINYYNFAKITKF